MKSIFYATLLTLFTVQVSSAQSLKLIDLNGNDMTNAVFSDVYDTSSIDPYEFDLDVINTSANNILVSCVRSSNQILPQSESYFCWDVCYSPIVSSAFTPLAINAQDTLAGYFHAYFLPNFQSGTSTMRYRFANTTNAADTASFTFILYTGTLGIDSKGAASKSTLSNAYPNPSKGIISIKYSVEQSNNSALQITNDLGQVIYQESLNRSNGVVRINSADFKPGIYFYSLVVDGAVGAAKKLVITQ